MLPIARGLGACYLGKDLQHNCFGARQNHMEQAPYMRLRLFYHSVFRKCVWFSHGSLQIIKYYDSFSVVK